MKVQGGGDERTVGRDCYWLASWVLAVFCDDVYELFRFLGMLAV